jgi:hypothetical protein
MSYVNTVLNQLLQVVNRHDFENRVKEFSGDRYVKKFDCWNQFTVLLYAQLKGHDSLRDIVEGLKSHSSKLYHAGLNSVARSTLSDANNLRDYRIYKEVFYDLLKKCQSLTPKHPFKFKNPLYSLDSSIIELSLSVFPWADYNKTKGAMKLHCLLDHSGTIPSFVAVTLGRKVDITLAKETDLPLMPDSIVVMDRGYIDFEFLYNLHQKGVFFVTRTKKNMVYNLIGQHETPNIKGLINDFRILPAGVDSTYTYPEEMRVIWWHDEETDKDFEFMTNNFKLAASTIAAIYKARWQIELFFKWIKQNLKIKTFLGTSLNAVLTQIWIAMCCYLLLAYIKYQTRYRFSLLCLTRVIKETLMDRRAFFDLLSLDPDKGYAHLRAPTIQLALF